MESGSIDIVIPTLGRPTLDRLLQSLARSEGPLPETVYVVDDRKGPEALLSFEAVPRRLSRKLLILSGNSAGPAAARNIGWRESSAEWVAFLDDDVVVSADWLKQLQKDLRSAGPEIGASQGKVEVPLPKNRRPTDWERNVAGLETAMWITADMAYLRKALQQVGGFDERFPRAYREDADFAIRVQQAGWGLVRGSRSVSHPVGPSQFWTSVKLQAGNADDAMMRRIHGPRWRTLAGAKPGSLASHAVATVALAAGCFAGGRSRTGALIFWAGWTARFAWKRITPGPRTAEEIVKMTLTSAILPPLAIFHRLRGELGACRIAPAGAAGRPDAETSGSENMPIRAVLFDRDGTLVEDVPYNGDPDQVQLKPGAAEAIQRLRDAGIPTAVVSNQSGVARGLLSMSQVHAVNARIEEILGPLGPWVICEHGPEDGCDCRKPAAGMIIQAARLLGVHPCECVVVGDIGADVEAARNAGAASILVPGPITLRDEVAAAPVVASDLLQAVDLVLGRMDPNGTNGTRA